MDNQVPAVLLAGVRNDGHLGPARQVLAHVVDGGPKRQDRHGHVALGVGL